MKSVCFDTRFRIYVKFYEDSPTNRWFSFILRRVMAETSFVKNFGPNVIYFGLGITENRPAGAFWADEIVKL